MKHLLLAVALFLSVVTPVSAQATVDDGTFNEAPAANNGQTGTTTQDDRGGFNWWWLLPLLAIPLFFVFKSEDRYDERSEYRDRGVAGAKGGETRRRREEDDETDEVL